MGNSSTIPVAARPIHRKSSARRDWTVATVKRPDELDRDSNSHGDPFEGLVDQEHHAADGNAVHEQGSPFARRKAMTPRPPGEAQHEGGPDEAQRGGRHRGPPSERGTSTGMLRTGETPWRRSASRTAPDGGGLRAGEHRRVIAHGPFRWKDSGQAGITLPGCQNVFPSPCPGPSTCALSSFSRRVVLPGNRGSRRNSRRRAHGDPEEFAANPVSR